MASEDEELRRLSASAGSRCEWHPETVTRLLDSYADKCARSKGYLKTRDWEEIVRYVNIQFEGSKTAKTMKQCREKVDSLKRRYKAERSKAELRGSGSVDWLFYDKLDEIMRCVRRTNSGGNIGGNNGGGTVSDLELVDPLDFDDSFEDNQGNKGLDIIAYDDKGKGLIEAGDDGLCDVVLNSVGYENGVEFIEPQSYKRRRSEGGGFKGFEKNEGRKMGENVDADPLQALADAVVGFSEVYRRIEVAKMELFSKMSAEIAKLRKCNRKKQRNEDSGCSGGSDSGSSESCSDDSEQE